MRAPDRCYRYCTFISIALPMAVFTSGIMQFTALRENQKLISPVQLDSDFLGRRKAEQHTS